MTQVEGSEVLLSIEAVMNRILANSCPTEVKEDGWTVFRIETHCIDWEIEARCTHISTDYSGTDLFHYEIRSAKMVTDKFYDI